MAAIVGFTITINAEKAPDVRTYSMAYSYRVIWDDKDPTNGDYTASIAVYTGAHHDLFGQITNDVHMVTRKTGMPVDRKISVPADLIDHSWGENVVLRLRLDGPQGHSFEAFTSTEVEHEAA